jgi:hypothetical protein
MGSLYYDWVSILRNAGCTVAENSTTNGWQRRARSSGGFSSPPLGVWWHHTASQTSPQNDLEYMINGSSDRPVGNLLLDRTGTFWPIAGGASNCAGKGGPWTFSRGTCPLDSGNTYGMQLEVANNGVGEAWPAAQMDAYFRGSNALNAFVGNRPDDVVGHAHYAPTRKIDPATASAVQGSWRPRSINSSGTWNLDDIKAECRARAGQTPSPNPPLEDDDQMLRAAKNKDTGNTYVLGDGKTAQTMDALDATERDLRVAGGVIDVATKKVVYSWANVGAIPGANVKKYVGNY